MLRRDLLNSNINIIEILEDFEKIKELRINKHNTFLYLKAYMKEIHSLVNGLRSRFPKMEFDQEEEIKRDIEKVDIEFEEISKNSGEFERLEKELFALKEKLKEVS